MHLILSVMGFFLKTRTRQIFDCRHMIFQSGSVLPGHVFSSRAYFFDNPRRYDSDDDLAWSVMPQNIQAR